MTVARCAEVVRHFEFTWNSSGPEFVQLHGCLSNRTKLQDWRGPGRPSLLSGEHYPVSVVPSMQSPPSYWVTPAWDYVVSNFVRRDGTYAPKELNLYRHLVQKGDVVCDLGSHIGSYAVPLAAHVGPRGRVFAFEPFRPLCGSDSYVYY
ncbi:unnamed protein product [Polarella glacialis]|uniref:tRNA(Phe) (4-demethylwyosine(37)-C(7)) aminocarboxypropyltransferase n=1 Tax=Polarella glacialis TaxID=89957 RepID=A0A813DTA0_POLGL|nr:unnamed protein product [Polarella glacialis]CAE8637092.1 unnamed protein product [Polarella glacialis]